MDKRRTALQQKLWECFSTIFSPQSTLTQQRQASLQLSQTLTSIPPKEKGILKNILNDVNPFGFTFLQSLIIETNKSHSSQTPQALLKSISTIQKEYFARMGISPKDQNIHDEQASVFDSFSFENSLLVKLDEEDMLVSALPQFDSSSSDEEQEEDNENEDKKKQEDPSPNNNNIAGKDEENPLLERKPEITRDMKKILFSRALPPAPKNISRAEQLKLVSQLLKAGADPNCLDSSGIGFSSVHWAVFFRRIDILHLLLQSSGRLDIRDKNGKTPYYYAEYIPGRYLIEKSHDSHQNHRLYSWGNGKNFALGHGDDRDQEFPKAISALSDKALQTVVCCNFGTMVLTKDSQLYSFGFGGKGLLGQSTFETVPIPTRLPVLMQRKISSVSCGTNHALCIDSKGLVWSWGSNEFGQTGHESRNDSCQPESLKFFKGRTVQKIAAGHNFSWVVCKEGSFSFGCGDQGCLGLGNLESSATPTEVVGMKNTRIKLISAEIVCVVVSSDDNIHMWGCRMVQPQRLTVPPSMKSEKVVHLSTAQHHVLVVMDSGKAIFMSFMNPKKADWQFQIISKEHKKFVQGAINDYTALLVSDTRQLYEFNLQTKALRHVEVLDVQDVSVSGNHMLAIADSAGGLKALADDVKLAQKITHRDFSAFLNSPTFADVKIKLPNSSSSFFAHLVLLICRCDLFKTAYLNGDLRKLMQYDEKTQFWTYVLPSSEYNDKIILSCLKLIYTDRMSVQGLAAQSNESIDELAGVQKLCESLQFTFSSRIISDLKCLSKPQFQSLKDLSLTTHDATEPVRTFRVVLSSCSEFFYAMLTSGLRESKSNLEEKPIFIGQVDWRILNAIANEFCLSGTVDSTPFSSEFVDASAQFLMPPLRAWTCSNLIRFVSFENVAQFLELATECDMPELHHACYNFCIRNFEEVIEQGLLKELTNQQREALMDEIAEYIRKFEIKQDPFQFPREPLVWATKPNLRLAKELRRVAKDLRSLEALEDLQSSGQVLHFDSLQQVHQKPFMLVKWLDLQCRVLFPHLVRPASHPDPKDSASPPLRLSNEAVGSPAALSPERSALSSPSCEFTKGVQQHQSPAPTVSEPKQGNKSNGKVQKQMNQKQPYQNQSKQQNQNQSKQPNQNQSNQPNQNQSNQNQSKQPNQNQPKQQNQNQSKQSNQNQSNQQNEALAQQETPQKKETQNQSKQKEFASYSQKDKQRKSDQSQTNQHDSSKSHLRNLAENENGLLPKKRSPVRKVANTSNDDTQNFQQAKQETNDPKTQRIRPAHQDISGNKKNNKSGEHIPAQIRNQKKSNQSNNNQNTSSSNQTKNTQKNQNQKMPNQEKKNDNQKNGNQKNNNQNSNQNSNTAKQVEETDTNEGVWQSSRSHDRALSFTQILQEEKQQQRKATTPLKGPSSKAWKIPKKSLQNDSFSHLSSDKRGSPLAKSGSPSSGSGPWAQVPSPSNSPKRTWVVPESPPALSFQEIVKEQEKSKHKVVRPLEEIIKEEMLEKDYLFALQFLEDE